jgi:hypothetical protein
LLVGVGVSFFRFSAFTRTLNPERGHSYPPSGDRRAKADKSVRAPIGGPWECGQNRALENGSKHLHLTPIRENSQVILTRSGCCNTPISPLGRHMHSLHLLAERRYVCGERQLAATKRFATSSACGGACRRLECLPADWQTGVRLAGALPSISSVRRAPKSESKLHACLP